MKHPMDLLYPTPLTDVFLEQLRKDGKLDDPCLDRVLGTLIGTWLSIGWSDEKIQLTLKDIFS